MESRADAMVREKREAASAIADALRIFARRDDADEYATLRLVNALDHYIERSMQGWVR